MPGGKRSRSRSRSKSNKSKKIRERRPTPFRVSRDKNRNRKMIIANEKNSFTKTKNQGGCFAQVYLDVNDYTTIMEQVLHDKVEYGGNFAVDFKNKTMYIGDWKSGKHSEVDLCRGLVDWHTHPKTCINVVGSSEQECTIPAPSHHDLVNILKGTLHGTVAHFLFTELGTWVIVPIPTLIKSAKENFSKCEKDIMSTLGSVHQNACKEGWNPKKIQDMFCSTTKKLGFDMELFPQGRRPGCALAYDCKYQKESVLVHVQTN